MGRGNGLTVRLPTSGKPLGGNLLSGTLENNQQGVAHVAIPWRKLLDFAELSSYRL
jgi:hypothetical protein